MLSKYVKYIQLYDSGTRIGEEYNALKSSLQHDICQNASVVIVTNGSIPLIPKGITFDAQIEDEAQTSALYSILPGIQRNTGRLVLVFDENQDLTFYQ